jgi:apolipoprotein N-acyltransferase
VKKTFLKGFIAVLASLFSAFSLPPFNHWYLLVLGLIALSLLLKNKFKYSLVFLALFFLIYFFISLFFLSYFSWPGFIIVCLFETILFSILLLGLSILQLISSNSFLFALSFASLISLAEFVKDSVPFGGLPLGSMALSLATSPFKYLATLGGSTFVIFIMSLVAGLIGQSINLFSKKKFIIPSTLFIVAILIALTQLPLSKSANNLKQTGSFSAVLVQGGGQVGLHAVTQGDPEAVFLRQVYETEKISPKKKFNLILWPEDTVALSGPIKHSQKIPIIESLAKFYKSYLLTGVTIPVGQYYFYNQAIEFSPNGSIVGKYEKIHRVPFGEYIPYRSFFSHFGPTNLVPRDAIPGQKPGVLLTPFAKLGVMISFEVFFGNLARDDVNSGANVLVVPTNTASYKTSQVPSQELAADRLRAIETGRTLIQASPVGYSDAISKDGNVIKISPLKKPYLISVNVDLFEGKTIYDKIGKNFFALCYLLIYMLCICFGFVVKVFQKHRLNQK